MSGTRAFLAVLQEKLTGYLETKKQAQAERQRAASAGSDTTSPRARTTSTATAPAAATDRRRQPEPAGAAQAEEGFTTDEDAEFFDAESEAESEREPVSRAETRVTARRHGAVSAPSSSSSSPTVGRASGERAAAEDLFVEVANASRLSVSAALQKWMRSMTSELYQLRDMMQQMQTRLQTVEAQQVQHRLRFLLVCYARGFAPLGLWMHLSACSQLIACSVDAHA